MAVTFIRLSEMSLNGFILPSPPFLFYTLQKMTYKPAYRIIDHMLIDWLLETNCFHSKFIS